MLFFEENKFPRTLFEARKVSASGKTLGTSVVFKGQLINMKTKKDFVHLVCLGIKNHSRKDISYTYYTYLHTWDILLYWTGAEPQP